MPFSKQFWRPLAMGALAVAASGALGVAHARKAAESKTGSATQSQRVATGSSAKSAASAKESRRAKKTKTSEPAKGSKAVAALAAVPVAAAVPAAIHASAEARLLKVIDLVQQQKLDVALQEASRLTSDVPHFQAAQLVYADLLRYKTGHAGALSPAPLPEAGAMRVKHTPQPSAVPGADSMEQLRGLQDEIKRRVQGANALPATGSIPAEFLALAPSVRQAIAIDASKSRLYLFANEGGKLRLTGDYYVSVGKLGMGKLEEGDQRTPEGVYFIGRQIPGPKLPEFYGKGALTVNYPNDWDKVVGRSGSGIWLHGTPPDQFARLPLASDGCMVLANTDLTHLMRTVERLSPVLVRERLHWVAAADAAIGRERDAFLSVLDRWQQGWSQADAQTALSPLYQPDWRSSAGGQAMQERMATVFKGGAALQDISVFAWKDAQGEIRIANLRLKGKNQAEPLSLRQYWRKVGSEWKLFSEDTQN
ncbi:hypothetical protein ABIE32_003383 [Comamonas sp. 4034]